MYSCIYCRWCKHVCPLVSICTQVQNPADSIKVLHLHASDIRNYVHGPDTVQVLPPPPPPLHLSLSLARTHARALSSVCGVPSPNKTIETLIRARHASRERMRP